MAGILVNASTGTTMSAKSFQRSYCGEEFDEYVYRGIRSPFPFSPVGAAERTLDFWKDRRFKIHYHGMWREGKVLSWKQYNANPSTMVTSWMMEVEMDTIEPGDEVNIVVSGIVSKDAKEEGAVAITSEGEHAVNNVVIKPESTVKLCSRMKLHVNRLNVEGGGTVQAEKDDDDDPLISLEWLEPASPFINLNRDILIFACPYCRETVPVSSAFDASPEQKSTECPVCLETTECRVLHCGHGVCHSCWSRCRHTAMRTSEDLGDIDESEMKKERNKRNRLFKKKRGRDGEAVVTFLPRFAELAEEARDAEGLERLRWELMVEHPAMWASDVAAGHFEKLTINGLKVLLQVMELRTDEVQAIGDASSGAPALCARLVAKAYDMFQNYRAAVPWAELSVHYARTSPIGDPEQIRDANCFASMVQAKADLFTKSLESFDAGMGPGDDTDTQEIGRALILKERNKWVGTSGILTPGI